MDKQMEEMAKDLQEAMNFASQILFAETKAFIKEYHRYHSKNDFDKAHGKNLHELEAEYLTAKGYRKASDVAREIFAEIDKRFEALLKFYPLNGEVEDAKRFVDFHWKYIKNSLMCDYDAELKKEYTEGGE